MPDNAVNKSQSPDVEPDQQALSEAELDEVQGGNWPTNQTPSSDPAETPSARANL